LADGALLVDARQPEVHAAGRVVGSWSIPAGPSFGTWLGWVVDPDRTVVLLVDDPAELDDLSRQALRIGFDGLAGHVAGGYDAWLASGRPHVSGGGMDVQALARELAGDPTDRPFVVDVRQASEFETGHVPGAWHIHAGSLADRLDELPRDRPIACICASGYRASVAASMLRTRGFDDVRWVADGVPAWEAAGYPLEFEGSTSARPATDRLPDEAHAH
jgi:hydroxyacylglutathione hydrolase